jgi:ABC-2 type transport system permease protein
VSAHAAGYAEPPATEMHGPTAFSGGWRRFLDLARVLALSDFKLRFFDSALGYLWTLMRPLLLFGVLYFVFSQVFDVTEGVDHYTLLLLSGMVLYFYVSEATGTAVTSLVDQEQLVRKVHFPRIAIPLSVVFTATINLAMNLIAVFVFILASGVEPRLTWLELPLLLAVLFVFSLGISMLVSALYVPARDVEPIWTVVLQAAFYATPVLYPIEFLARENEQIAHIAMANPLATVIQQMRYAVIDPDAQSAGTALGGTEWLLVPAGIVIGVFVLGLWVFNRMAPMVAEEL